MPRAVIFVGQALLVNTLKQARAQLAMHGDGGIDGDGGQCFDGLVKCPLGILWFFAVQIFFQRARSRATAAWTSVIWMPTLASLAEVITQLERGVFAAVCMKSASSLKKA